MDTDSLGPYSLTEWQRNDGGLCQAQWSSLQGENLNIPEFAFCQAMLELAVKDLVLGIQVPATRDWILADEWDVEDARRLPFNVVCGVLRLDPDAVRRKLGDQLPWLEDPTAPAPKKTRKHKGRKRSR